MPAAISVSTKTSATRFLAIPSFVYVSLAPCCRFEVILAVKAGKQTIYFVSLLVIGCKGCSGNPAAAGLDPGKMESTSALSHPKLPNAIY
jgi:hypothetical protein